MLVIVKCGQNIDHSSLREHAASCVFCVDDKIIGIKFPQQHMKTADKPKLGKMKVLKKSGAKMILPEVYQIKHEMRLRKAKVQGISAIEAT